MENSEDEGTLISETFPVNNVWNSAECPFKIGELVQLKDNERNRQKWPHYAGGTFKITGAAKVDEESYEFSLEGVPYLVWDSEIEKL